MEEGITPEIQALIDKSKVLGPKLVIYIYLYKDEDENPFKDLPYYQRESEARFRVFGDYSYKIPEDWKALVEDAIETYPVTDTQKDIYTYNKKMDELDALLKDTKPKIYRNSNVNTNIVSFSTNISIINTILKDITNIIQAKASLIAMHIQGTIPKHLRGGLSPLAKKQLTL